MSVPVGKSTFSTIVNPWASIQIRSTQNGRLRDETGIRGGSRSRWANSRTESNGISFQDTMSSLLPMTMDRIRTYKKRFFEEFSGTFWSATGLLATTVG